MDKDRAVLFGGKHPGQVIVNSLYLFNMRSLVSWFVLILWFLYIKHINSDDFLHENDVTDGRFEGWYLPNSFVSRTLGGCELALASDNNISKVRPGID